MLKGLIHRAHYFCDTEEDLKSELELLQDVFIINGYPMELVKKTIEKSWEKETKKMISQMIAASDTEAENEDNDYHNVLHAPYIQNFSEKTARELKKLNIGWVLKRRAAIKSKVQDLKPPESKLDQKDVIYKINCRDCRTSYIGETGP